MKIVKKMSIYSAIFDFKKFFIFFLTKQNNHDRIIIQQMDSTWGDTNWNGDGHDPVERNLLFIYEHTSDLYSYILNAR